MGSVLQHQALCRALPRTRGAIELRRLDPRDLVDFQAYRTDPEVGRFQGWSVMNGDEALVFLHDAASAPLLQAQQWTQIAISTADDGRLIGDIGILMDADRAQAEIGFTLAQAFQGEGLATLAVLEAIDWLFAHTPVHRIVGITDARNLRSIRLLQRVGMTFEATAEASFRGELCMEHTYSLVRPPGQVSTWHAHS